MMHITYPPELHEDGPKQTSKKTQKIGPKGAPLQPGGSAADGVCWAVTSANDLQAVLTLKEP
jgi:hypothetical protein